MLEVLAVSALLLAAAASGRPERKTSKPPKPPAAVEVPPPAPAQVPPPVAPPSAPARPLVFLKAAVTTGPVPGETIAALERGLEEALRKLEGLTLITARELRERLSLERQQQLTGAPASEGAAVSLSAIDAATHVSIEIAAMPGEAVAVTASRLDGSAGKVLGTRKIEVPSGGVLEAAPRLIAELFPEARSANVTARSEATVRPIRIAVLGVRAQGDVPERAVAALDAAVAPEVRKLAGVSAIGSAEILDMIGVERQKQLLGCAEEATDCMVEVSGALDADELISFDVTLVGSTYAVAARRTDLRAGSVLGSQLSKLAQRDGEELLSAVGSIVAALYPDRALRPGKRRGVEESIFRRLNPPPLPTWVFASTVAVAAGGVAVGAIFHLLMLDTQNQYNRMIDRTEGVALAEDLISLERRAWSHAQTRNGVFIAAGALALVAIAEALFTDWRNDRAAPLRPSALGVSGSF